MYVKSAGCYAVTTAIGVNVNGRRRARVVEIDPTGLIWIKASGSGDNSGIGDCVEMASGGDGILVRRFHGGARLEYSEKAWRALLAWAKS
jgi:hypothetical protein